MRVNESPPIVLSGTMATASWVASSTIVRIFMTRPSAVRSNTKSIDQTWLAARGRPSGCRSAIGIFLRLRLLTCKRASAYRRSTRLWLTTHQPGAASNRSSRRHSDDADVPGPQCARAASGCDPASVGSAELWRSCASPEALGAHSSRVPSCGAPARDGRVRSPLFRNASRVTSISSIDSAIIFFSRAFSLSSSFRRLASDTLIPPNLLRGSN